MVGCVLKLKINGLFNFIKGQSLKPSICHFVV